MARKKKARAAVIPKSADRRKLRKANENARDQFAAVGLFIQNFENIVDTLRDHCSRIMRGGDRGIPAGNPKTLVMHWNICSLVFHHEAITARTILDLWRALVFEQCRAMLSLSTLSEKGNEIADAIVKEIAKAFADLIENRNRLIHASWAIGRWLPEQDFSELRVEKYRVGKDGLERRDDLPRSFDDLINLSKKAEKLWGKLGRFLQFFEYHPRQIEHVYSKSDGEWTFDRSKFDTIRKPEPSPKKIAVNIVAPTTRRVLSE